MKFRIPKKEKTFEPIVIEITLESAEQVLRLKNALGYVPANDGFFDLFNRLGELYQEVK